MSNDNGYKDNKNARKGDANADTFLHCRCTTNEKAFWIWDAKRTGAKNLTDYVHSRLPKPPANWREVMKAEKGIK